MLHAYFERIMTGILRIRLPSYILRHERGRKYSPIRGWYDVKEERDGAHRGQVGERDGVGDTDGEDIIMATRGGGISPPPFRGHRDETLHRDDQCPSHEEVPLVAGKRPPLLRGLRARTSPRPLLRLRQQFPPAWVPQHPPRYRSHYRTSPSAGYPCVPA